MDRKVSSSVRAAGANFACKDQCNAFPGLLQDFGGNWLVKAWAAGGFAGGLGMVWACIFFQGWLTIVSTLIRLIFVMATVYGTGL